jgi:hypothetical protein
MIATALAKVRILEEQNFRLQQALEGLRQLDDAEIAKWVRYSTMQSFSQRFHFR